MHRPAGLGSGRKPDIGGGELPIRIDGRTYLVTRPTFGRQQAGVVYLHEKDRVRCVAAVGAANGFEPLDTPEIIAKLGAPTAQKHPAEAGG